MFVRRTLKNGGKTITAAAARGETISTLVDHIFVALVGGRPSSGCGRVSGGNGSGGCGVRGRVSVTTPASGRKILKHALGMAGKHALQAACNGGDATYVTFASSNIKSKW
jgi:hypothetical protein